MANAKFIDATTWGNLTEVDVTDGENLFPQLPAGTYRPVLSGVDSVTVPALSAGTIDQATPTEGDTLTVSGSNATGSATYQWQKDGVDISGATSASLDTTGEGAGDYRRGVSDGVQGPVYTSAVTVGAAATAFDVSYLAYGDSGNATDNAPAGNYTVSGISFGAADADRSIVAICHTNYNGSGASTNGEITAVTIGGQSATKIVAQRADGIEVSAWIAAVPTGTSGDVVATMNTGVNRFAASTFRVIDGETGDTASATVSFTSSPVSLDVNTSAGGAVIAAVQTNDATTALSFSGTTKSYENDIRTNERAAAGLATGVTAETPRTVSVSAPVTRSHGIAFALSEAAG